MKISDTGVSSPRPMLREIGTRPGTAQSFNAILASQIGDAEQERSSGPILLGTITKETPTVSQLLYKGPLKDKCWQIIHDKANTGKPFHRIRPGTQIYYNPETRELVWGKDLETMQALAKSAPTPRMPEPVQPPREELGFPPMNLSDTAKQFIGRDYDQMDCYELLVGGLEEMGVQYGGSGGLYEHLVNQASQQGLAKNHYLTGEGLVSASGTDVFKKTYHRITDPAGTVEEIMAALSPRLEPGQVLSFSMKNHGHTGVISRLDDQWTFINSGTMDNNLSGENGIKGVGEERLAGELLNWFKLANREKSALQITLGSLSPARLSMFKSESFRQKV